MISKVYVNKMHTKYFFMMFLLLYRKVVTLTICVKQYYIIYMTTYTRSAAIIDSFEVIFDQFLTYIVRNLYQNFWFLSSQELEVYPHKHSLSRSSTKKSNIVKSHDLGGQLISPEREITRLENVSLAIKLCGMWHHLIETTYSPNCILQ